MDQPVVPFDWARMFLGDEPPLFFLEILFRTVVIYAYTFLLVRWIGGRTVAQLSMVEFLLVIALGSAVGDPLFQPDVPLLHAMLVITVVVLINKGLDTLMLRHGRIQRAIDGVPVEVIRDGRLQIDNFTSRGIARAELMEQLRLAGISNLGAVAHAFVEANGSLSVFRRARPVAGLPIVPPAEIEPPVCTRPPAAPGATRLCCARCGALRADAATVCRHCGGAQWTPARPPSAGGR